MIVQNERPAPDLRLVWEVGAALTVSIGVVEGAPKYGCSESAGPRGSPMAEPWSSTVAPTH